MRVSKPVRWVVGGTLALALLVGVVLVQQGIVEIAGGDRKPISNGVLLWALLAGLATLPLLLVPRKAAAALLVAGSVALLVGGLVGPDRWTWSSDQYRYRWDARVQLDGIDPYRYADDAPELAHLRDSWLWPSDRECKHLGEPSGCSRLNHEGSHTVYPPVAEAFFTVMEVVPGPAEEDRAKLWMGSISTLLVAAVVLGLYRTGKPVAYAAVLAWGPAHGLESVLDGHVDALGVLLVVLALWVLSRREASRRALILGGVLVGLAISVKFYPGVVLVAFLHRRFWPVHAAAAGTVLLSYLPHLLVAPTSVLGYLPEYVRTEGYSNGTRFLLLDLVGIRGTLATVLVLVALGVMVLLVRSGRVALVTFLGVFFLLVNPVQTWYTILLIVLAVRVRRLEWVLVALAAYPTYADPLGDRVLTGQIAYGSALVLVALVHLVRFMRSRGKDTPVLTDEETRGLLPAEVVGDREDPLGTMASMRNK